MASRHRNFYVSVASGLVAGALAAALAPSLAIIIAANVFFVVYLVLTFVSAQKLSADFLRKHAAEEDAPAPFILLVMLVAVAAAAVSLFLVLHDDGRMPLQLGLGALSVVLGWFAVHTMWAMHYAFEYYQVPENEQGGKKSRTPGKIQGGLAFPGEDDPTGIAFVYFAYVVGMTAQTSDTNVTSNGMRRLVLVHGVFSFFFNTVIVAAAVNIGVALSQ
jgi:uncharacterized membrane protein